MIMDNIEKELADIKARHKYLDEQTAKRLERVSKRFEGLVNRGLAQSRGYNLMTSDNTFFSSVRFNVPNSK